MRTYTPTEIQVQTRNEPALFLDSPRTSVFDRLALGAAAIALAVVFTQTKVGADENPAEPVATVNVMEASAVVLPTTSMSTPLQASDETTERTPSWLVALDPAPTKAVEELSCTDGVLAMSVASSAETPNEDRRVIPDADLETALNLARETQTPLAAPDLSLLPLLSAGPATLPTRNEPACFFDDPEPEVTAAKEFEIFTLTGHRLASHENTESLSLENL